VWISTLVNKLAFGTARLPLKVYNRAADGARSEARDTPLARLLRNPNSRHDPFFFWLWTVSTFEVYGEAMWVKVRPGPGGHRPSCGRCTRANVSPDATTKTGALIYATTWDRRPRTR
jgi:phage portal protein BeeE